jgi:hypothetical protein
MVDKKKDDDLYIEFNRDFGYRGVHLGKGFVLDASEDRAWAEHLVLMGDAKKVDKPDQTPEKPWEEALKERQAEAAAEKAAKTRNPNPTAAKSYDAPAKK